MIPFRLTCDASLIDAYNYITCMFSSLSSWTVTIHCNVNVDLGQCLEARVTVGLPLNPRNDLILSDPVSLNPVRIFSLMFTDRLFDPCLGRNPAVCQNQSSASTLNPNEKNKIWQHQICLSDTSH